MTKIRSYTPFFVAAIMPMLVFSWFVPKGVVQIDLWLLWLLAMGLLGLPMMFLELALARRSKQSPWVGMQSLTRESDTKTYWRIFALLSVVLSLTLAVGFLARFSENLVALAPIASLGSIPSYAISFALVIVSLILSPLKHRLLGLGTAIVVTSAIVSMLLGGFSDFAITNVSFKEWAVAVIMALFSMGVGTGLYWFLDNTQNPTADTSTNTALSSKVLPVWLSQIAFGAVAFGVASTPAHTLTSLAGGVGVVMIASFLINYAATSLSARFGMITGIAMTAIIALLLSALPSTIIGHVLVGIGLLCTLVISLFAGWQMKISHLRKSLNFKSELRYNLWRVAVRWLVPLAVLSALIGWFINI